MSTFETVAIWGLGLMGGSLAAALKVKGFAGTITGISGPTAIEYALESGFIDAGFRHEEYEAGVDGADLVILASPIRAIMDNLSLLAPVLNDGAVVTDIGSTKLAIVNHALNVLPRGVEFIGGHPMAGSEQSGIQAADAGIYENAVWVLTPRSKSESLYRLTTLLEHLGSKVLVIDPRVHDRIAARISHMPQVVAVALMNTVGIWNEEEDLTLRLAGGGFRDMTRIAASPFEMWSGILETNRDALLESLDTLIGRLRETREAVSAGTLKPLFEQANRFRLSVPRDTRGFADPLHDVMVVVRDEPGVLSRISTRLADNSINIRDIEVLKVRIGDGGTMRLAFSTDEEAHTAVKLLMDEGIQSWVKA